MFYVRDIFLKYGDRTLFNRCSFMIGKKERIGLIGRNGAGKSTLLKIISNKQVPDDGKIEFPSNTTIGYLEQDLEADESLTVIEAAKSAFDKINAIQDKINAINEELGTRTDYESEAYMRLIADLGDLTDQLAVLDVDNLDGKIEKVLKGLGFDENEMAKQINQLSGGWKMRVELAKLLLQEPDLLLLDEPTNHLDIESIIWLEKYLLDYTGIVILISHDTLFLNNVCNRILEIELGKLNDFKGNYEKYKVEKAQQREVAMAAYENQAKDIAQKERTITRFMAKATKTKMAQSMQKQLDKIERIEIPIEDERQMKIRFSEVPRSGLEVLLGKGVSKSYGDKDVLNNVDVRIERNDRVAFVGQNGQGKTTLAKILIGQIPTTGGDVKMGTNVHLSYYAQNQSELLNPKQTILEVMEDKAPEELRSKARTILGSFLFTGEDSDKKVSVLSGGERARLAMASLIMHPCNLLVLDEPTNHLDIQSKEVLKQAVMDYTGTLVVVSHDRDFLKGLTNKVIEFKDGQLNEYLGDIEYYLEKKQLDDMRAVELQKKAQSNISDSEKKPVKQVDHNKIKAINKKIRYVERDISKIEEQMKEYGVLLSQPDFYMDPSFVEVNKKLKDCEHLLNDKMEEWEVLAEELDAAGG
jgi:ATP-binding cassette subfamily F protein 3